MSKDEFITCYLDDYVRMAYRKLTHKVNIDQEFRLINILYSLLDKYAEGELLDYIHYNKIV